MILLSIWILWDCSLRLLSLHLPLCSLVEGPSSLQWMVCYSPAKASPSWSAKLQVSLVSGVERPRALRVVQVQCVGQNFDTGSPEVQEIIRLTWYLNFMENLLMAGKSSLWLWLCQCPWCSPALNRTATKVSPGLAHSLQLSVTAGIDPRKISSLPQSCKMEPLPGLSIPK